MVNENNTINQFNILTEIRNWKNTYATYVKNSEKIETDEQVAKESIENEKNILAMISSFEKFCSEYINELSSLTKPPESKVPLTQHADSTFIPP